MKLSREETETIIRRAASDSTWDICTADLVVARKMVKMGYKEKDGVVEGYRFFTAPKRCISFRNITPRKPRKSPNPILIPTATSQNPEGMV